MSVVHDPLARAKKVTTEKQAARLKSDLEVELALNDDLPAGWEAEAEQAISWLDENYPGASDHPAYEEGPRSTSRRAQEVLNPRTPKPPKDTPASSPAAPGNPRPNRKPATTGRRARVFAPLAGARAARSKVRSTAALGGSWGLYAYKVIGWGIGLSVLLLVLGKSETAGKGKAPLELLFGGFSTALAVVASPSIDPLSPRATPAALPVPVSPAGRPRRPTVKARPHIAAAKTPLGAVTK